MSDTAGLARAAADDGDDTLAIELPSRPYPGLRPFDRNEWPIFFGRERMVDAVVSRLVASHLVVVHGDSGSGKSSLVRAGALPRLEQQQARCGARWRTGIAYPRGGPLRNLARALAEAVGRSDDADFVLALRRALNLGRDAAPALNELLLLREHDQVCVLVDQFEELFDLDLESADDRSEAQLLCDLLQALPERGGGLYLLVTMRSEFLGACARFAGLAETVNAHQYLLPPMSRADLVRAVVEPAELYGGMVEPALAERLAADAQDVDGLPLVQHALMLLQTPHMGREGWTLSLAQLTDAGGARALLSDHADRVLAAIEGVPPQQSVLLRELFSALTQVSAKGLPLRRPQRLPALLDVTGAEPVRLQSAIDALRADGVSFLVLRPDPQGDWVDIGHEALMRCWTTLSDPKTGWLQAEFRNGLIWRTLLVQAEAFEANPASVLSEAATEIREAWLAGRREAWAERYGGGHARVRKLIEASVAARDVARRERAQSQANELAARLSERRRKEQLWGGAGLITALGVVGGVYLNAEVEASRRGQWEAQARADVLSTQNREIAQDRDRAQATATELQSIVAALRSAESKSQSELRAEVQYATRKLDAVTEDVRSVPPRVYLHITDPSQRPAAEALRGRIGQIRLSGGKDGWAVSAPGVQLVPEAKTGPVLRCFRQSECQGVAKDLLQRINALLVSPRLQLQDLSARYENDKNLRPHHYEVWLGREAPVLVSAPVAAPALPEPVVTPPVAAAPEVPRPAPLPASMPVPAAVRTPASAPVAAQAAPSAERVSAADRARLLVFRLDKGRRAATLDEATGFGRSQWDWSRNEADKKGVRSALGLSLIFDTAVAHGTRQADTLDKKVGSGGEKAWAEDYLRRRDRLTTKAEREAQRTAELKNLVRAGDWELKGESAPAR